MKKIRVSSFLLVISGICLFLFGFFSRGFLKTSNPSSPTSIPTVQTAPNNIALPNPQEGEYVVSEVLDGDTIRISTGERVRYFGIDTPEVNQSWASEATWFNKEMVEGKQVRLELDNPKLDKYGRILTYVWVRDQFGKEIMVNKLILEEGYSKLHIMKGDPKLKYLDILIQAEKWGREHHNGLWFEEWVK